MENTEVDEDRQIINESLRNLHSQMCSEAAKIGLVPVVQLYTYDQYEKLRTRKSEEVEFGKTERDYPTHLVYVDQKNIH